MHITGFNASSAWRITLFLSLLYALSMLDRYILALLAQSIITEFHISDQQMGLLLGAGFAILYSVAGLPVAHFIDRGKRIPIVVGGVIIWSLSTMAAAFATGFWTLGMSRAGVAIGEAVLTPAAISMIADLFPKEKRGAPVAVYAMSAAMMSTGSIALGGLVFNIANDLSPMFDLAPWRITLLLVGAPGIVLALLLGATTREPARTTPVGKSHDQDDAGTKAFFSELKRDGALFFPFYVGIAAVSLYIFGLASWAPTILIRSYGLKESSAGYLLGVFGIPGAIGSALLWPSVADNLQRRGWKSPLPATMLLSAIALLPVIFIAPFVGSALAFGAGVGAAKLANSASTLASLTIQHYGSGRVRGRLTAVFILASNVFGLSGGALLVPMFANFWPGDPNGLIYGLAILGAVAATFAIPCFWLAQRAAASITAAD